MERTPTVKQALKHLEWLSKESKAILEGYDKKIEEAESMNLLPAHINKIRAERTDRERLYDGAIDRAKIALKQAQEAEKAELAQAEALRQEAEERVKERVRLKWTQSGGDAEGFEAAWPGLREAILVEKTLDALREEAKTEPIIKKF